MKNFSACLLENSEIQSAVNLMLLCESVNSEDMVESLLLLENATGEIERAITAALEKADLPKTEEEAQRFLQQFIYGPQGLRMPPDATNEQIMEALSKLVDKAIPALEKKQEEAAEQLVAVVSEEHKEQARQDVPAEEPSFWKSLGTGVGAVAKTVLGWGAASLNLIWSVVKILLSWLAKVIPGVLRVTSGWMTRHPVIAFACLVFFVGAAVAAPMPIAAAGQAAAWLSNPLTAINPISWLPALTNWVAGACGLQSAAIADAVGAAYAWTFFSYMISCITGLFNRMKNDWYDTPVKYLKPPKDKD
jgi:hypothetical protein